MTRLRSAGEGEEWPKNSPPFGDLTEAIYRLSLAQMRSTAIMQSVLEQYQGEMSPKAREKIERFLKESFEDADKINTQFGEFEW